MSSSSEIQHEVKKYLIVFTALLFLTIVTVAISYLHLSLFPAITMALIVATVKASLVACYFMHLISEKKLIYFFLGLAVIFFFTVLLLPLTGYFNNITGSHHVP